MPSASSSAAAAPSASGSAKPAADAGPPAPSLDAKILQFVPAALTADVSGLPAEEKAAMESVSAAHVEYQMTNNEIRMTNQWLNSNDE